VKVRSIFIFILASHPVLVSARVFADPIGMSRRPDSFGGKQHSVLPNDFAFCRSQAPVEHEKLESVCPLPRTTICCGLPTGSHNLLQTVTLRQRDFSQFRHFFRLTYRGNQAGRFLTGRSGERPRKTAADGVSGETAIKVGGYDAGLMLWSKKWRVQIVVCDSPVGIPAGMARRPRAATARQVGNNGWKWRAAKHKI
jgi:hypothetical protein